jgi:hypothetical protein
MSFGRQIVIASHENGAQHETGVLSLPLLSGSLTNGSDNP